MKAEKGITLVALVITIIVLLILAVVTIKLVIDGGIMGHANNAATKYNAAMTNEYQQINSVTNTMNNYATKAY